MRRAFFDRARLSVALLGAFVLVACGLTPLTTERGVAPRNAPNVLVIVTDDQRAKDTLGVMPAVRKWFRKRGTRFSQAFATTPLCCPSRASIMTGQYAHNHRVTKNNRGDELPQARTVQRALWMDGYNTALAGKYLNGWDLEKPPPFFDRYAMQRWGYYEADFNVDGVVREVAQYSTGFVADQTIEFLEGFEQEDEVPWFTYVAPFAAHKPYATQARYAEAGVGNWSGNPAVRERRTGDKPEIEGREITKEEARAVRRGQLRTLLTVDDMVGRFIHWLRAHGELAETLAIFVSDNGRSWGEHGLDGKRLPYTESIQIPLLMRWPGHVRAGKVDRRLVTNVDIAPTIFAATGIRPTHNLDGLSLLGDRTRQRLLLEHWGHFYKGGLPSWASTRTRDYQYVEYYGRESRRVFREYYNLRKDPWQLKNLFGDRKKKNDPYGPPLKRQLTEDRRCRGRSCP